MLLIDCDLSGCACLHKQDSIVKHSHHTVVTMIIFVFLDSLVDCGSVSQNLSDDFAVSVEAWHLLNTHTDYKNGML